MPSSNAEDFIVKRLIVASLIMFIGVGLGVYRPAAAQPVDVSLTSERQPVRIALQPTWQQYDEDGYTLSEWSAPLLAVVPLQDDLLLGLRTGLARAGGSELTSVTGLADVQATLSYSQSVGEGSVIFNVGVNLPSGTTGLTVDEFETMTQLSQNFYAFRMPGLGQGVNLSPGVTWAVPAGERVMLGLGASYQMRGGYTPVQAMDGTYNPGNEVRLTGGTDVQVGDRTTLSGDVTLTLYGTDTIDDEEQYGPGRKLSLTAQYQRTMGFNAVRAVVRYQSQAKSNVPTGIGGGASEALRVLPNQGTAFVVYRVRVHDDIDMVWRADGRLFGETSVYASKSLFSVGTAPEFALEDGWTLTSQLAYTFGSFTGIEAGLGVVVEF